MHTNSTCDSKANRRSNLRSMNPILNLSDTPVVVIKDGVSGATLKLGERKITEQSIERGQIDPLSKHIQQSWRRLKISDREDPCSASDSTKLMAVSSPFSPPDSYFRSQTSNATQSPSILDTLIHKEETQRSSANDYKALNNVSPTFHKQVWRERVAQWCYDVLDYLEESRDVAAVTMNIIDRYLAVLSKESSLSTESLVIGEFDYEIISFTALFLAIRVSGSNKELEISELLQFSNNSGAPQVRHIVKAGNSMLEKLSWNHQILTPKMFLKEFVALLVTQFEDSATETMMGENLSDLVELSSYLVEISVCDIFFSTLSPSKVAFGALALSMMFSDLFSSCRGNEQLLLEFFRVAHERTSMNIECPQINSILVRLLQVYNQSQEADTDITRRESFRWDRSDLSSTYQKSLPHIIVDEVDGNNACNAKMLPIHKSGRCFDLHHDCHHVYTKTNQSRPVSPLPHSFS